MKMLRDAFSFAADLHASQRRKGRPVPFLAHLMSVAALVLEDGGNETEAAAALLHDAIEDSAAEFPGGADALRGEIRSRFGGEVLEIVEYCTDAETLPKPPWRPRKEAYIARIAGAPVSVRRVMTADKLHNLRCLLEEYRVLGEDLWGFFNGGREGTLWYYRAVYESLRAAGEETGNLRELGRVVGQMEKLAGNNQK